MFWVFLVVVGFACFLGGSFLLVFCLVGFLGLGCKEHSMLYLFCSIGMLQDLILDSQANWIMAVLLRVSFSLYLC